VSTVGCDHFGEVAEQIVQLRPEFVGYKNDNLPSKVATLVNWLNDQFLKMAMDAGAKQVDIQDSIEKSLLERAGYFESFSAHRLVKTLDGKLQTPAACYQCYPFLSGRGLREAELWTCSATCGRNEAEKGMGRLRTFHMREIVLVGSADWVHQERRRWMEKVSVFARSLGLDVELAPASDSFFDAGEAHGRKLMQQLKQLKFEMLVRMGQAASGLAIASFNLHERFFSERFGLHLQGGEKAYTGCIAFGLERWALALVAELGFAQAFSLAGVDLA
jgi:seryl-tRNA synthetase